MNDQIEKKDELQAGWTLSNVLAVVGFVVLVILLAWLAIQFVRMIPTAWNSLANVFNDNQRALVERTTDENADDKAEEDDSEDPVVVVDGEDLIDDEEDVEEEEDEETTSPVATSTPSTTPSKPVTPQYRTVATYVVPTSNPNGYTDLEVSLVAVGEMTNDERFIPGTSLETNELGAMQFRVKNIGTKTSSNWHFVADLPNGDEFKSIVQQPLKPGEMTTLTVSFATDRKDGIHRFGVDVYGNSDINTANNGFTATVNIR